MLTIYTPRCEDLWFREQLLSDAETMSYNHTWGGTIRFPKEQWKAWHDHWVADTDGKRYYRYLKNEKDEFIGEIAYHYDPEVNGCIANVIVHAAYRGKGYGGLALEALCSAAKGNGVPVLYDDIAIDNPAVDMFLKHGFSEAYRTNEKIILKKEL